MSLALPEWSWIAVTLFAVVMQSVRTAGQKQLTAHLDAVSVTLVRFLFGLPFAAAYSSSKSGLSLFAESLRLALKLHGVSVTLASPGFFSAAAGDAHTYARPGEIGAERVAERIIEAAAAGKSEIVTPCWFMGLKWLGQVLPRPLRDRLLQSLPSP